MFVYILILCIYVISSFLKNSFTWNHLLLLMLLLSTKPRFKKKNKKTLVLFCTSWAFLFHMYREGRRTDLQSSSRYKVYVALGSLFTEQISGEQGWPYFQAELFMSPVLLWKLLSESCPTVWERMSLHIW